MTVKPIEQQTLIEFLCQTLQVDAEHAAIKCIMAQSLGTVTFFKECLEDESARYEFLKLLKDNCPETYEAYFVEIMCKFDINGYFYLK